VADGPDHQVLIIGAGFSGIGTAIALDGAGIRDWLIAEDGEGVGGAWHWNTYPGAAVDIPSFSYQFSFEPRAEWSRVYAPQRELKEYAEHCVEKYGLRERIRFDTKIVGAKFDEELHLWRLSTSRGEEITARFVIGATGVFTQPKLPDIEGVETFGGVTMHTARWDHSQDLKGKRVGVIGTGASALQLIPSIAPDVSHLTVFQRTPIWCLPKPDRRLGSSAQRALRVGALRRAARGLSQAYVELTFPLAAHFDGRVPLSKVGERSARQLLRKQVRDPELRRKLTPDYSLGCKRPSFSNDYLPTFNRDNVALETTAIESIRPAGVHTADGAEHPLDVMICATGFKVFESGNLPPFQITGIGGVDLDQWWDENRYQAYQGVSVPGFPNFFSILGPYGFNGASYFTLIEAQSRHILRLLRRAGADGATMVEVTREANDRYFAKMLGRRHNQVFFQGTCDTANSYYFDKHGDVPFRAATTPEVFRDATRFDLGDYRFERLAAGA
jgi:cation diffusion facilitator CzcD-associated flavoprotein CzcO